MTNANDCDPLTFLHQEVDVCGFELNVLTTKGWIEVEFATHIQETLGPLVLLLGLSIHLFSVTTCPY